MDLAELGETFRQARIRASKTQQQVAEQSGVTRERISRFESGVLRELGTGKLLSLFEAVGLELLARPIGHGRTLDDVLSEQTTAPLSAKDARQRVRPPRAGKRASGEPLKTD